MLTFETVNELTLKVICQGSDILYTKAGAFIAGESGGAKNYRFEKVLLDCAARRCKAGDVRLRFGLRLK